MKHVSIICATAKNRAIGYKNRLLYRLPDDLKYFKKITTGSVVVMGGNTYKSLPNGPLPDRMNIVLSTSIENEENYDNLIVFSNSDEMLSYIENTDQIVFIIGGASIYNMFIDVAEELYLTEIEAIPLYADTFFPYFNCEEFIELSREHHPADERHDVSFDFVHYKKKH